ncbi:MAG: ABC transporter ATP-binding protein [Clostridium sp.]
MNSYQNKITIENLSKKFDEVEVLKNINISVEQGEIVSIIGPSGCGKSTIFNAITGLLKEYDGNVKVNGELSYMYQKDMMLPWKSVSDNIALPLILKGNNKITSREKVNEYLENFGLKGYEGNYPNELSGGMRQRANFLKTYLTSDDIMLLDEPFGALDSLTRKELQMWLLNLKKEMNTTIMLITHDIDEAIFLSDKVYVLSPKPCRLLECVDIKFDSKRDRDLELSDEYRNYKQEILTLLLNGEKYEYTRR